MKFIISIKWYLLSSLLLLLSAIVAESILSDREYNNLDTKRVQKTILHYENNLEKGIDDIVELIPKVSDTCCMFKVFNEEHFELYKNEGVVYLFYKDSTLGFWTDNIISVPRQLADFPKENIVGFGNTLYFSKSVTIKDATIFGLFQIETDFPYENSFLTNGYRKDFKISNNVNLILEENSGGDAIYDAAGDFLFALDYSHATKTDKVSKIFIVLIYLLFFISILLLIRRSVSQLPKGNRNLSVIIISIFLLSLFRILTYFRLPAILFEAHVFKSFEFNAPSFLPSVGEVFVLALLIFYIIYTFYIDFNISISKNKKTGFLSALTMILFIIISFFLYLVNSAVFRSLILNTEISFETYKALDLSFFTFIGFGIMALSFASFAVFTDKLLAYYRREGEKKRALIFVIILISAIALSSLISKSPYLSPQTALFYSIICLVLFYFRFLKKENMQFSSLVIYIFLFSLITLFEANKYSNEKNISEMKTLAVGLSAEHDPIAELLFSDLKAGLNSDEEIQDILYGPGFEFDLLYNTIARKYFSGFWDKYDLQITVCGNDDSVFVSPPIEAWYPCYSFFYDEVLQDGMLVPGTEDIYYLDNLNGRISYFLAISYDRENEDEVSIFLELNSRLVLEGLGYPGLLVDESLLPEQINYSYAKYHNNQLITSVGDFNYSTRSDIYSSFEEGFNSFESDGFDHLAYRLDNENTIILSKASVQWVDLLISFSYIFGFYFLSILLLLQFSQNSPVRISWSLNFKTKIQWGMTSVIFFSFILIGIGTVYFSINQYKEKQYEILEEKVQSVYVELIHKLEFESDLYDWSSESYFDLNELLQKFSNVFYSDINLFDKDGYLLASSRPEIFQLGLISTRMNATAFKEMSVKKRSEFIQSENIGNLDYLSVYVPFVNTDNKLLAYLNLPYFTKQDVLTREIANLVVAIINIIVLLSLLSFTLAVFMANTITNPLNLLQQKFSRISLSEKNEIINYKGNDEIGNLVKEYNLMVNKLQNSVELLAISERESAWREMAKQIAHEIKNPLTPMKLNIQHLQRTINENPEDIKEHIDRISKMLIEQIENLSTIATEFSSFAKMPKANSEVVDLERKLKNSIELFTDYGNCILSLKNESPTPLLVFADKEQLSRVFINLIKNAIQSIPENTVGRIEIKLEKKGEMALIRIKDNGKGIPDAIRGKLFQPNFTTKSSGMGLGLAIVRNIMQNADGEIYFETEYGKGSTFFVELPLVKEKS